MQTMTYTDAFRKLQVPGGTLVFTDFDLLTDFELEAAAAIAVAVKDNAPQAKILNSPLRALERAPLLRHLRALGLNSVEVTRVDEETPTRFPVFIRLQGGCEAPDTGLLQTQAEFEEALSALTAAGRPLRGRIAVSFDSSKDADGYFRKYGAFRIGDHIVPQHVLRSKEWYIKRADKTENSQFDREEIEYIAENPHKDALMRLFEHSGHEFGRADYTLRDGEIVLFEINSNPTFPNLTKAWSTESERYQLVFGKLRDAFASIDTEPEPRGTTFELSVAIGRKIARRRWHPLTRWTWRSKLKAQ